MILKIIVRNAKPTAAEIANCDMNGDGRVTPMDALIILKIALGTG